jgi:hypothetical protein
LAIEKLYHLKRAPAKGEKILARVLYTGAGKRPMI